jgi:hypothetical protein
VTPTPTPTPTPTGGANDTEREEPSALGADLIIPGTASALAVYYLVSTADLAWEARATGTTIAMILLALSALLLFRSFGLAIAGRIRLGFGDLFEASSFNAQRVALIVLAALFVAAIHWAGTTLGIFVLLILMMLVTGVRSPRQIVLIATASAMTVYLLFIYLLNSRMPRGYLEGLLGQILPPLGG